MEKKILPKTLEERVNQAIKNGSQLRETLTLAQKHQFEAKKMIHELKALYIQAENMIQNITTRLDENNPKKFYLIQRFKYQQKSIINKIKQIQNAKFLNFFPVKATETIRLKEAIFACLTILNFEKKDAN